MRVLVTGGGTGGHVTPILAVAAEIKEQRPKAHIYFVGESRDPDLAKHVHAKAPDITVGKGVLAGKWRRYHGESLLRQLLDIPSLLLNLRDLVLFAVGFFQSLSRLRRYSPDVVFAKGGYVSLPVGLAAAAKGIPLVIHDSDTHPGLANRILARWADKVLVGYPPQHYTYPAEKMVHTGVPVAARYTTVSNAKQREAKRSLGFGADEPLLLVTGGSLGAAIINETMLAIASDVRQLTNVVHITGQGHERDVKGRVGESRPGAGEYQYSVHGFIKDGLYTFMQAADIVVSRAGATTIAELAAMGKASIIIPNPMLAGGHQLTNARVLESHQAAVVLPEETIRRNPRSLLEAIGRLLGDKAARSELAEAARHLSMPHAARHIAHQIVEVAEGRHHASL